MEKSRPLALSPVGHARTLVSQGRLAEAVAYSRIALDQLPCDSMLWFWMGSAQHMQKLLSDALHSFQQALSLDRNPTTLSAVATVLVELQRYPEACELAVSALELRPGNPYLLTNLATVLMNLGRLEEALGHFDTALQVQPGLPAALINRGIVLSRLGRHQAALDHNVRAIALLPQVPEVYFNHADTLIALFRYEHALKACERGLALAPQHAELNFKKGLCLAALGRFEAADAALVQARVLNPQVIVPFLKELGITPTSLSVPIDAKLVYMEARYKEQMYCYWPHRQAYLEYFNTWMQGEGEAVPQLGQKEFGFQMFSLPLDAKQRLKLARLIGETVRGNAKRYSQLAFQFPLRGTGKLRIGYVSPDFRTHPTGMLTRQIYAMHDRNQFEIYAYSLVDLDANDAVHADIVRGCDVFRHVARLGDVELARLIHEDDIDILIDLAGYTTFSRSELFALRPAPVQLSYVGFVESMGADFIDYVLTDASIYPFGAKSFWHEQAIRMPHHVLPYDNEIVNAPMAVSRNDYGLPENAFVFCCLNNSYKIEPEIFDTWANILKAVPDGVLWLLDKNEQTRVNLQNEAKARGIAPERLIFAPFVNYQEHTSRYQLADLFLDTLWHNAHTTALEAVWQGLPLLTREGEVVSARLAASCLKVLGMPELVTHDLAEYQAKAIFYAQNPAEYTIMREKLKAARYTSPLFNTALTVKHLEYAFQAIWQRHQQGKRPESFDIPDLSNTLN